MEEEAQPLAAALAPTGEAGAPPGAQRSAGQASGHGAVFARMGRNLAWVIGGKGFSGVVSLAYVAIAARTLGPTPFGAFTLILAYGQAIANLVQFQSWQAVIRYGAAHIAKSHADRLAKLLGFTATLDVATAVAGAALAALGVRLAGPLLGWSPHEQYQAALFGSALLLSVGATPYGILRLYDRFDLLTYCEGVGPLVRLIGSIAVWLGGGGVPAFLAVWAAAALLQAGASWLAALWINPGKLAFGRHRFATVASDNVGIWRFMLLTNASSSLSLFWQQLGTLAVGGVSGAATSGGFRIATKLAKGIAKPLQTMTRVLYPELARLIAANDRPTLGKVIARVTWIGIGLALVVVAVAGFGGRLLLDTFAGRAFRFAEPPLLLLAVAAAIDLSGFAFEPLLTAHGKAGRVLRARAIGAASYVALLIGLLPTVGPLGAAIAAVFASLIVRGQLAVSSYGLLRRKRAIPAAKSV